MASLASRHILLQAEKRDDIAQLIQQLECLNPLQSPTEHLEQVAGKWRLLYTTIRIVVRQLSTAGQFCALVKPCLAIGTCWHAGCQENKAWASRICVAGGL